MRCLKIILTLSFLIFPSAFLFSQSNVVMRDITIVIPEVQLINAVDATGNPGAVTLVLTTNVAGTKLQSGTGTSYVQVSSIVAPGQTRRIQASYDQIPVGTTLSVTGVLPSGNNGSGSFGASANTVKLSTTPKDIFTGIGSCYTNTGPGDGYKLDWQWNAGPQGTYSFIIAISGYTTIVTFTITAGG